MQRWSRFLKLSTIGVALIVAFTTQVSGQTPVDETPPAVRVMFLDKLGARAAQKMLMAEGVRRVATVDEARAVVVSDSPERVDAFEALLRRSDPGLLSKAPHAPLAARLEGAPTVERSLALHNAKGSIALLRVIYGISSLEPSRDGQSVVARDTAPRLDAAEKLLHILGLLDS